MSETSFQIEPLAAGDVDTCEKILRSLGEWFGVEGAIREYRRDLETLETWVARGPAGVIGFLSLADESPRRAMIRVMAVRREYHRRGVGRALVAHAEAIARDKGFDQLEVRTLGPSCPDEGYAGTRAFYTAMGFEPVSETTTIWGLDNPCLILRKRLAGLDRPDSPPKRSAKPGPTR